MSYETYSHCIILLILTIACLAQKKMVVFQNDGTLLKVDIAKIDSIIWEDYFDESHAVDLGLSIKWCDVNLGAKSPEQYGNYFAWGETSSKESYEIGTYKFCQGDFNSLTKYNYNSSQGVVDGLTRLDSIDDAAHVLLQEKWRIPTKEEYEELIDKCTWEWTMRNGVSGHLVTGPNGNSIFLPVAGYLTYDWDNAVGKLGQHWTSSLAERNDASFAHFLAMDKSRAWIAQGDRYMGRSIRAVYASESPVPDVSHTEPMVFGISESRSTTRAAQASSSFGYLGNIFNVYGCRVKGSEQECFIDDYCVWYNGIDTATSCNGWNYVGKKGHEFNCPVTSPNRPDRLTREQSVRYWMHDGSVCHFYAYSAPEGKATLNSYRADNGEMSKELRLTAITAEDNVFCAKNRITKYDASASDNYIAFATNGSENNQVLFDLLPVNAYVRFGFYGEFPDGSENGIKFVEVKDGSFTGTLTDVFSLSGTFVSQADVSVKYESTPTLSFENTHTVSYMTFDNEPLTRLGTSLSDVTYVKPKHGSGSDGSYFAILPREGSMELRMEIRNNYYYINIPQEAASFTAGTATTFIFKLTYTGLTLNTIIEPISFGRTDSVML